MTQPFAFPLARHLIVFLTSLMLFTSVAGAQILTTFAGGSNGDGGLATRASLMFPKAVVADNAGNIYVAVEGETRIRKIAPDGIISTVLGIGYGSYSGDGGPGNQAAMGTPSYMAVDGTGYLYVVDRQNARVRRVSPAGIVETIAGNGIAGFSGDGGPALNASLNNTQGIAVDPISGAVYIVDNNVLRKFFIGGRIGTVAGTAGAGFSGDGGLANSARFAGMTSLASDSAGNIYVHDSFNFRIRKIDAGGYVTTIAGNGLQGSGGDAGLATSAAISNVVAFSASADGTLHLAEYNSRIRRVLPSGIIYTIAGSAAFGFLGDGGPAVNALLDQPSGVAADSAGNVYIGDKNNLRVRRVTLAGIISTFAGGSLGDGGPAALSSTRPEHIAFDASGAMLVADTNLERIRRIGTDGVINTIAGTGLTGFSGDGAAATLATLSQPEGIVQAGGRVVVADFFNNRLRAIDGNGVITSIAGTGDCGSSGDGGPATLATLCHPRGLAVDAAGSIYIADENYNRIRKVDPSGIITTLAGTGNAGFSGDGGPAAQAAINRPTYLTFDADGNLFFSDTGNARIRRISTGGIISTYAGNGIFEPNKDFVPATSTWVSSMGLAFDADGNLYFGSGQYVRRIDKGGILTTIAGNGMSGIGGPDGLDATQTYLDSVTGLLINQATRTLYFTDYWRIRQMTLPQTTTPVPLISTDGVTIPVPSKITGVPTATHAGLNGAGVDMNAYAVNPARCGNTQPAITHSWHHNVDISNVGAADTFNLAPNEALTYAFAVSSEGQGSVTIEPSVAFPGTSTYMTITLTPCDFDVNKLVVGAGRDFCYATAPYINTIAIKSTYGAATPGFCRLVPGNVYYLNVRFQDARPAADGGTPTADACAAAGFPQCGGVLSMQIPDRITVNSVSPLTTFAGQTMTINGHGLSGASVTIGGVATTFVSATPTQIVLNVPANVPPFAQNLVITTLAAQSVTIPISVATVPGAPTLVIVTPGDQILDVYYQPAPDNFSSITRYTISCSPGAITVQSTSLFSARVTGLTNGQPYTCDVRATNAVGTGPASATGTATPQIVPQFLGAYSRKIHGAAGTFDLPLFPANSLFDAKVEPRFNSGGVLIAFKFDRAISSPGNVVVRNRAFIALPVSSVVAAGDEVLVTLPSIADGERISLEVTNIDGTGAGLVAYAAFLAGDANGSRAVTASDISAAKARSGITTNQNFRFDLDLSGSVTQEDVVRIKQRAGNVIVNN